MGIGEDMTERSKSETLQTNERIKHAANALTAFCVALSVAITVRLQTQGIDIISLFWIVTALALIWVASLLLTLLRAEDEL
jgi:hypothetical protein